MQAIRVRNLVKRYGPVLALDSLDLQVGAGEIVSVVGPNGAGKSTLLRILGTVVLPDAGSVSICGVDVTMDAKAARRQIGLMIGDERALYWRLSGRENLRFFAALHGIRRREAARRAAELLRLLGLEAAADRRVLGYSSGMRARLLLARALLSRPPALLLDEPTRTLDPVAALRFREIVVQLAREHETLVLLATHDLHEAVAISSRVVILSAGRVALEQSTEGIDASRLESELMETVEPQGPRNGLDAVGLAMEEA